MHGLFQVMREPLFKRVLTHNRWTASPPLRVVYHKHWRIIISLARAEDHILSISPYEKYDFIWANMNDVYIWASGKKMK